jgi:hypothetical protein
MNRASRGAAPLIAGTAPLIACRALKSRPVLGLA